MNDVDPAAMILPPSIAARCGERVCWYAEARPMAGVVQGHDAYGQAIILDDFGIVQHRAFDDVRLADPLSRAEPNWCRLPPGGRLLRPSAAFLGDMRRLLALPVAPGPSYAALAREIWARGFEVYFVGGCVRDLLAGLPHHDLDVATTMPVASMLGFLEDMYRTRTVDARRGHVRVGGAPGSGEPCIDINSFVDSAPGTDRARFGGDLGRDVAHRDFACNALYFDAVNEVLADPTGRGADDCASRILSLIDADHDPRQMAQIFIRAVKLMARGFSPSPQTRAALLDRYRPRLGEMDDEARQSYFEFQVLAHAAGADARRGVAAGFREALETLGCEAVWSDHFAAVEARL